MRVNDQCIWCWTCWAMAPDLFKVDGIPATVLKQPETPEEQKAYEEAKASCPVSAIE